MMTPHQLLSTNQKDSSNQQIFIYKTALKVIICDTEAILSKG